MKVRGIDYTEQPVRYEVLMDDDTWEPISRNEIEGAEANGIVVHWNPR